MHYRVNSPAKAKRSTSFKRKTCLSGEVGEKRHRRASDVGRLCDPGMANKENELTYSDDVHGCGIPVNFAEASKMAEASSKYSDFTEVWNKVEAPRWSYFLWLLRLVYWKLQHLRCWVAFPCCFCLRAAIKGPRSYDAGSLRKKSSTQSSPDTVAKECQRIRGLPNKVKQLWLMLLLDVCIYSLIGQNSLSSLVFVVSQNSRHRCAAWLLTCVNKQVSDFFFFFLSHWMFEFYLQWLDCTCVQLTVDIQSSIWRLYNL